MFLDFNEGASVLRAEKFTVNSGSASLTGTADYTHQGVLLDVSASLRFAMTALERAKLFTGGHIRFEIESGACPEAANPGVNQDWCGWAGGGQSSEIRHNGIGQVFPRINTINAANRYSMLAHGIDYSHREVVVSFDQSRIDLYIDRILFESNLISQAQTDVVFSEIVAGSIDSLGSLDTHRIRNYHISTQRISPYHVDEIKDLNVYGDSFLKIGQYPTVDFGILAETGDGLTGSNFDSIPAVKDSGCVTVLHRELARLKKYVGRHRINCWHEGGTGVLTTTNLYDRVSKSLTNYPTPSLALIHIGTNDATTATLSQITGGTWLTEFKRSVDLLLTSGCPRIVILSPTTATVQSLYGTQAVRDKELALLVEFQKLNGFYPSVTYIDEFTAFGGHAPDPADFGSLTGLNDDRHPSFQGHAKLGKLFKDGVIQSLGKKQGLDTSRYEEQTGSYVKTDLTSRGNRFVTRITDPGFNPHTRHEMSERFANRSSWGQVVKKKWFIDIPDNWVPASPSNLLSQFHAVADAGDIGRPPPLALEILDNTWQIVSRYDADPDSTLNPDTDGRRTVIYTGAMTPGRVNWEIEVFWSFAADGYIKVWRDGVLIVDVTGQNAYNDTNPPYFKYGVVVYDWGVSGITERLCYAGLISESVSSPAQQTITFSAATQIINANTSATHTVTLS